MKNINAIRWVFFLQPFILGAWFPRIPQVQQALELSAGQLAFALIGMPVGLLSALAFGARVAEALGTKRLLIFGAVSQCLLIPLPAVATSGPALFFALAIAGIALAVAQLSLNVTASLIENASKRHIMNGCHGFWSVGVLLGSALGSFCAAIDFSPGASLYAIAALSTPALIAAANRISNFDVPKQETNRRNKGSIPKSLVYIALFGFGISMTEGAMADWSAVYLTEIFDASPGKAGLGYSVFALCVAAGRFLGDPLKARIPVDTLARSFVIIALGGLMMVTLGPSIGFGFFGIALLGLGVSLGFPLAVSAASRMPGRSGAANVAFLTQVTLCGFLVGPPVIGLVADNSSMRQGLAALGPALLVAAVLASHLKPKK